VKILAPALAADPRFRDRFEREARVVASLNHRTSARCSISAFEDTDYLVMEYLEGDAGNAAAVGGGHRLRACGAHA
jgi:eukaryotic-like serine/threonine-protein kinase